MNYRRSMKPLIGLTLLIILLIGCGIQENQVNQKDQIDPKNQIEGKITQDNNPAAGATLNLSLFTSEKTTKESSLRETQTDENGHFVFQEVLPGEYTINVPIELAGKTDCKYEKVVTMNADERITLDIEVPTNDPDWNGMKILEDGSLDYFTICER